MLFRFHGIIMLFMNKHPRNLYKMEVIWFPVFTVIVFLSEFGYGNGHEWSDSSISSVYNHPVENKYGDTVNILNPTISDSKVEYGATASKEEAIINYTSIGMNIENLTTITPEKNSLDILKTTNYNETSMNNGIPITNNDDNFKISSPTDENILPTSETGLHIIKSCLICNSSSLLPTALTTSDNHVEKHPFLTDNDGIQNKSEQISVMNSNFSETKTDDNLKESSTDKSYEFKTGFDPYLIRVSNSNFDRKMFEDKITELTLQAEKDIDAELNKAFNNVELKSLSLDSLIEVQEQVVNSTVKKIFSEVENIIKSLCLEVGDQNCFLATYFHNIGERFVNCSLSSDECDALFETLIENSPLHFKVIFDKLGHVGHASSENYPSQNNKNVAVKKDSIKIRQIHVDENSKKKYKDTDKQFRRSANFIKEDLLPAKFVAALHESSINPDKFQLETAKVINKKKLQDYTVKKTTENQLQPDGEVVTEKKLKISKRDDDSTAASDDSTDTPDDGGDENGTTEDEETTTEKTEIPMSFYLLSVTLPSFVGIALLIICICYCLRTGGWCCNLFLEDQEALREHEHESYEHA